MESTTNFFPERESLFIEKTGKDFNFFYEKYYPKLLYYTSRMAQSAKLDVSKAEDVSTDAFLTAFEKIDKYHSEKSQFSTWLFTIAKNLMLQVIKQEQKTLSLDVPVDEEGTTMKDFLEETESDQPHHDLVSVKSSIMLEKIALLKEPYKQVIEMREIKGMAYKDIAEELGKNLSTIKSQIRNGRKLLVEETEKHFQALDDMYV